MDEFWKLTKKATDQAKKASSGYLNQVSDSKYVKDAKNLVHDQTVHSKEYLDQKAKASQEYVKRKSAEALNQTTKMASEGAKKSFKFMVDQNSHLWNLVDFKNRSIRFALGTAQWIAKTKVVRWGRNGLILGTIGKVMYVYGTYFEREIEVSRTFNQLKETNGQVRNQYFIADNQKRLYQVVPSLWYWQWWPDELWADVKEGDRYHLQCYGWRIHKLRLHPRVVHATKIDPNAIDLDQYD